MKYDVEILDESVLSEHFFTLKQYKVTHSSFLDGDCPPVLRERLEGKTAVSILLFDPRKDAIVCVEQFRIGLMGVADRSWSIETVSGFCDVAHEKPQEVAAREVTEETGCELQDLIEVGEFFVSPGSSTERITVFVGCVDSSKVSGVHGLAHEGEEIRPVVIPREAAVSQLFKELNSTSIIIALQWLQINLDELNQRWL
jgi:ADP-ribose pyrophosphatase